MKLTIITAMLLAVPAWAQNTSADGATMQALLDEVHQLRLTMEKTALLGPRIQLALERARIQEQRVARVSQQLDDVRKQVAAESQQRAHAVNVLATTEQELAANPEGEHRKELESMRDNFKRIAEAAPDPQLSARDGELSSALQNEQAALNELNGKLDAIERQLEAPPPAGH
ncbi:MAG: hypothetical protein ABSH50_30000 [Bryobacteraceae bacterium]